MSKPRLIHIYRSISISISIVIYKSLNVAEIFLGEIALIFYNSEFILQLIAFYYNLGNIKNVELALLIRLSTSKGLCKAVTRSKFSYIFRP